MRVEPHAIERLAARLPHGQRRRLGHQRQDDDRRDGRVGRSSAPARGSCTTAPGRTWSAACSALAAAARRGGRLDGDLGPVRGRRVLARPGGRGARAARAAARQPVPRPARPLRRAGDDRRPLGRGRRAALPPATGSCSTPTTRWSPTSAATATRAVLRRRGRRAGAARAAARLGLQALPPLRPRLRLRGRLPRPPRPLPLPQLRPARGPSPPSWPRDVELRGIRRAAFTLATPAGERRVELPLPGLYNVYNALGAAALCLALGVAAATRSPPAWPPSRPRSGAPRRSSSAGGRPRSCSSRTPPARTRCCARSRSRARELDVFGVLNDRTADGRDVSWVWDADWELLAPHVRRMTCSGTRAAELALRLKYAGVEPERLQVVDGARARARRRAGRRRAARCTRCPPTRRCSSCASCSPAAARREEYWR